MPQPPAHTEEDRALKVVPMRTPSPTTPQIGRPKKVKLPPLPEELLAGLTPLEREYFDLFLNAYKSKQPMTPWVYLCLIQAGLEYVNLLRVQAKQLKDGQVLTAARQHPAPQVRAWLEMAGVSPRQNKRPAEPDEDDKALADLMKRMA